jgi:hypothetical protein
MNKYESEDFYTTVLSGGMGTTDTITVSSDTIADTFTLTGDDDNITINTDFLSNQTLTVGDVVINQNTLKDLVTLIDVLKELDDDNPLKALFDSKKMLDKMKIGK